jgi:hypothetical protein
LEESLGGNAKTCLIITCSPSEFNSQETMNTCRFGSRAKSIKNKAIINREFTVTELKLIVKKLEKEILSLKEANLSMRKNSSNLSPMLDVIRFDTPSTDCSSMTPRSEILEEDDGLIPSQKPLALKQIIKELPQEEEEDSEKDRDNPDRKTSKRITSYLQGRKDQDTQDVIKERENERDMLLQQLKEERKCVRNVERKISGLNITNRKLNVLMESKELQINTLQRSNNSLINKQANLTLKLEGVQKCLEDKKSETDRSSSHSSRNLCRRRSKSIDSEPREKQNHMKKKSPSPFNFNKPRENCFFESDYDEINHQNKILKLRLMEHEKLLIKILDLNTTDKCILELIKNFKLPNMSSDLQFSETKSEGRYNFTEAATKVIEEKNVKEQANSMIETRTEKNFESERKNYLKSIQNLTEKTTHLQLELQNMKKKYRDLEATLGEVCN